MKAFFLSLTLLACLPPLSARPLCKGVVGSWEMAPQLRQVQPSEAAFPLLEGTVIEADEALVGAAALLSAQLEPLIGRPLPLGSGARAIRFRLDEKLGAELEPFRKEECYAISVGADGVLVRSATPTGALRAVQTLVKALPARVEPGRTAALPGGEVFDFPQYAFRALMLDCARHFFPLPTLKKVLDILALHQVNRFHWHLSDDQGWRLEIGKYPRLTEVGSHRAGSPLPEGKGHDGVPVSGFYTREEAREIVAYAARLGIEVIPEIDMPGHMKAALASYPELGCTGGPYEVACEWGVLDDVLCAGKESTLAFVCDVLDEVMDIFPSRYIHIGGDECPKLRWEACPHCQEKIRRLGIRGEGKRTAEELLQSWFMDRVSAHLEARGRKVIAWNDALVDWGNDIVGAPSKNTVIAGWMRPVSSEIAVSQGYEAIFCPCGHLYLSAWEGNVLEGEAYLRHVFDAPVGSGMLGVEACIWAESVKDEEALLWRLLPRLALVSDLQWEDPAAHNYDTTIPRLARMVELYRSRAYHFKNISL